MSAAISQMRMDMTLREGVEYLASFWRLVELHQQYAQTERQFFRAVLQEQRNGVLRRQKHAATRRSPGAHDARLRSLEGRIHVAGRQP